MSSNDGPEIQIVRADAVEPVTFGDDGAMASRRLIRLDMGSERVSLNYTVTQATSEEFDSHYADHDELMFIISGVGEITWGDGESARLTSGTAVFVPRGRSYVYRVVEAPQEAVVVFGPAMS